MSRKPVDTEGRGCEFLALVPMGSKEYTKQGYVSLAEAAKKSLYSQEYLSLLARRGILPAVKFSRNWMTTHDAVQEYTKSLKGV